MENPTLQNVTHAIRFYRLPQLKARLNVSGSSIWAWVRQGKFPRPVKLSENTTAWDAASVDQWCAERIADSQR